MNVKRIGITFAFFASMLMACSAPSNPITGIGDTPEGAAKEWFQALADSDGLKLDDRTCSSQKEALQKGTLWMTAFGILGENLLGQKVKVDISDLKFKKTSGRTNSADVNVAGRIRSAVGLNVQSQQIDLTLRFVNEDGNWKYCGEGSPSGGLAVSDLMQLLPQSQDIPVPLKVDQSARVFALYDLPKETASQYQQGGVVGTASVTYSIDEKDCVSWCAVSSNLLLFKDQTKASESVEETVNGFKIGAGADAQCSELESINLGRKSAGTKCLVRDLELFSNVWQDENVLFILVVSARRGTITEQDVKSVADKMRSRLP